MTQPESYKYVSRGGDKLAAALDHFRIDVTGLVCADLGSHVGGFVDCLLTHGAVRVFAVDTAYGTLAWKLRRDPRVVVLERTNAMHVSLPDPVDVVTIDVGWTQQAKILPSAAGLLHGSTESGSDNPNMPMPHVITLIKPHYEAPKELLESGVLPDGAVEGVVNDVLERIVSAGWAVIDTVDSPIRGHGGNREVFALLTPGPVTA